jgi:hypothetical protein
MHSSALLVGFAPNFGIRKKRFGAICNALRFTSVMPAHKDIGKKNYNSIKRKDQKYQPLMRHFENLNNLGEVSIDPSCCYIGRWGAGPVIGHGIVAGNLSL